MLLHPHTRRLRSRSLIGMALAVGLLAPIVAATPNAQGTEAEVADDILVEGGVTQPVFGYKDAIREVVQVESPVSSHDGDESDIITVDIIRPAASDGDLDVPTIIIPSPYYSGPGRGGTVNRSGERKPTPPATPSVVAGDRHFGGTLLEGSPPVTGQAGRLVDCGAASAPSDCPEGTDGAVALIERDRGAEPDQVENVAAAGASGALVYANGDEQLAGEAGTADIPVLALAGSDGRELLDLAGEVEANLRELVEPIDFFPLYYDNVFVPRGYAVALVDLPGSRYSTGCLDVGGPAEAEGTAAVVEWLAGNGYAADGTTGQQVTADWSSGRSSLVGKSWDGTIAIAAAAQAPEGLQTIVPIAGLSEWHSDFWDNGARYGGSPTLWHDGNNDNPSMEEHCSETRSHLATNEENPDPNSDFWLERNWTGDVDDFEASVFIAHGKNDYNVKPVNFGRLWEALAEHGVPRKMWLSQVAHEKAFDFRREEWLDTIHRWYDYWLHGIDNGVTDEPAVDVEHGPGEWRSYDSWPGGTSTRLWLGTPREQNDPREGTLWPDARYSVHDRTASFREKRAVVDELADAPFNDDARRLAFLSPELSEPVRVSGQPEVTVDVRTDGENATLSALLVDYGSAERVDHRTSGGLADPESGLTCFGRGTETDTGCYPDITLRTHTSDMEVVSRGWVDAAFQLGEQDLDPGTTYRVDWGLQHHDYLFEEGHRIGVVIAGPESHLSRSRHPSTGNETELKFGHSRVDLPVVGGPRQLQAAFR